MGVIGQLLAKVLDAQSGWARPFGDFNARWLKAAFRPIGPTKDALNGRWLGHPLHAVLTDAPIGLLLAVIVLDVIGQPQAADAILVVGVLAMIAAAVSGLADLTDTDGAARTRATVHGTLMVVALLAYVASIGIRVVGPSSRDAALWTSVVAFLILAAGAFVGGEVVYALGNVVRRHAFNRAGRAWVALDLKSDVDLEAGVPTAAHAGTTPLVLLRIGDAVYALHDVCAHAGGSLSRGRFIEGCLECPLHGSRFRVTDGRATRGPTVYDQPAYELRHNERGGWEARRSSDSRV
jgi:nitrite reductase/ring-hydroxylating ferredoxin subunit/uncharacterized membrane protein